MRNDGPSKNFECSIETEEKRERKRPPKRRYEWCEVLI
jgi:hypothetical protein